MDTTLIYKAMHFVKGIAAGMWGYDASSGEFVPINVSSEGRLRAVDKQLVDYVQVGPTFDVYVPNTKAINSVLFPVAMSDDDQLTQWMIQGALPANTDNFKLYGAIEVIHHPDEFTIVESGDGGGQLDNWELHGVTEDNSDALVLYGKVTIVDNTAVLTIVDSNDGAGQCSAWDIDGLADDGTLYVKITITDNTALIIGETGDTEAKCSAWGFTGIVAPTTLYPSVVIDPHTDEWDVAEAGDAETDLSAWDFAGVGAGNTDNFVLYANVDAIAHPDEFTYVESNDGANQLSAWDFNGAVAGNTDSLKIYADLSITDNTDLIINETGDAGNQLSNWAFAGISAATTLYPSVTVAPDVGNFTFAETGDEEADCSAWAFAGVTDNVSLYVAITTFGGDAIVSVYSDAAMESLVAQGAEVGNNGGAVVLAEQNTSGISGTMTLAAAATPQSNIVVTPHQVNDATVSVYDDVARTQLVAEGSLAGNGGGQVVLAAQNGSGISGTVDLIASAVTNATTQLAITITPDDAVINIYKDAAKLNKVASGTAIGNETAGAPQVVALTEENASGLTGSVTIIPAAVADGDINVQMTAVPADARVSIYKNAARDQLVARGTAVGNETAGAPQNVTLTAQNASGLSGTMTIAAAAAEQADVVLTLTPVAADAVVHVYSDIGRSAEVCAGTKVGNGGGALVLAEQNGSGIAGTVTLAAAAVDNAAIVLAITITPDDATVSVYSDIACTALVARGTKIGNGGGVVTLAEQNASGISGSMTLVANAVEDLDISIAVDVQADDGKVWLYKDAAKTELVATALSVANAGGAAIEIVEANDSGISGTVDMIATVVADAAFTLTLTAVPDDARVSLYKDAAKEVADLVSQGTATGNGGATLTVAAQNGSGLTVTTLVPATAVDATFELNLGLFEAPPALDRQYILVGTNPATEFDLNFALMSNIDAGITHTSGKFDKKTTSGVIHEGSMTVIENGFALGDMRLVVSNSAEATGNRSISIQLFAKSVAD